jgi:hypothetical protein
MDFQGTLVGLQKKIKKIQVPVNLFIPIFVVY